MLSAMEFATSELSLSRMPKIHPTECLLWGEMFLNSGDGLVFKGLVNGSRNDASFTF
jgi:hypothetical protein